MSSTAGVKYKTGCPVLDIPLGNGLHGGKIIEIYAWEGFGKTTIAKVLSKAFADHWRSKGIEDYEIIYVDGESAFDRKKHYLIDPITVEKNKITVFPEDIDAAEEAAFLKKKPDGVYEPPVLSVERVRDYLLGAVVKSNGDFHKEPGMLQKSILSGKKLLIIWDTIAQTKVIDEINKGDNAGGMTKKPRVLRSFFGEMAPLLGKCDATLICLNQSGSNIGSYVKSDVSSGGGALRFYPSVRINLYGKKKIPATISMSGQEVNAGIITTGITVKNKLIHQGMKMDLVIRGESGLDSLETTFKYLRDNKLVTQAGSYFYLVFPKELYKPDVTVDLPVFLEDGKFDYKIVEEKKKKTTQLQGWVLESLQKGAELDFTSSKQNPLEELVERYPHLVDWMNYIVYKAYSTLNSAVKLDLIADIEKYEMMFFGKIITDLSEAEMRAARILKIEHQQHNSYLEKEAFKPTKKK